MKIESLQQVTYSSWWHSMGFRLIGAFLLGAPVGFLYRPLENPGSLLRERFHLIFHKRLIHTY